MNPLKSLLCAAALCVAGIATAQPYPNKPVRFIVPFAAGSSIDIFTRVVLDEIHRKTGATFVVEPKPGALGMIGTDQVAKSAPDGYTLMPSCSATHSSGPQLSKNVPYDALKDFTHLSAIDRFDLMLVTNGPPGAKTVEQLIEEGRKRKLLFGYGSATGQVGAEAFTRAGGIKAEGVSYKGQPLALNDLAGGHVDFVTSDIPSVSAQVRAGRLNALAVSSDRRSALFPDVPTLTEKGLKVELVGWVGFAGPAGLPAEVRAWWSRQVADAVASTAVVERFRTMGVEPFALSGDAFDRFVRQQYEVWGRHIREAGITPQ